MAEAEDHPESSLERPKLQELTEIRLRESELRADLKWEGGQGR